jgi:hypothetical protein
MAPKKPKSSHIPMAQQLPCMIGCYRGETTMPYRKRRARVAAGHHRLALPTALFLAGALLVINAWLVSQQVLSF